MKPSTLQQPLTQLNGIGPQLTQKFQQLDILSIADLLFHLPRGYQDRTQITPIKQMQVGQHLTISGTITQVRQVFKRRKMLICHLSDESSSVILRFFHYHAFQLQQLKEGQLCRCFGEVRLGYDGLEMIHPEYRAYSHTPPPLPQTLTAIYPTTQGLTQAHWKKAMDQALEYLDGINHLELIPIALLEKHQLWPLKDALKVVHQPPKDIDPQSILQGTHKAQRRLAIEECLAHRLFMLQFKKQQGKKAQPIAKSQHYITQILKALPFICTPCQSRVIEEISHNLNQNQAMMRLLQGDVGSGKTIVAACAIAQVAEQNLQSAMMAPTELLAHQLFHNIRQLLTPFGITVVFLSGKQKAKDKKQSKAALASGTALVAVGTHALFQKEVEFKNLALLVIDEQHRFGVEQRMQLQQKGSHETLNPHVLIMTATPIPRTLAMSLYADLDISTITSRPKMRKDIITTLLAQNKRQTLIERVKNYARSKGQVYWVCTLIEENEEMDLQACQICFNDLQQQLAPLKIAMVHGKMASEQKQAIMDDFHQGAIDVLIATTVIEVGLDVKNANLMVIENPERLGLSQLHQLRGRVGRGDAQAYCVLLYGQPLSQSTLMRLQCIRDTQNGFELAEQDLKYRGQGDLLGTRQSGAFDFRIANLLRDKDLWSIVMDLSTSIATDASLQNRLITRWVQKAGEYAYTP